MIGLLSIFITTQDPFVKHNFHHAATQDPGHGTKLVTLPSSV